MAEEKNDTRSFFNAAVMLGTYLICASIPVFYYLVNYHNCDHDRDNQLVGALLIFPILYLGKLSMLIMGVYAIIGMGLNITGIGVYLYGFGFVILCYAPYALLFWRALKPKNIWPFRLFIIWSVANAVGFFFR